MPLQLTSLGDLTDLAADTIIDVRSPAEFAEDHIPGAVNLPVLSNEERATVGTVYVQQSAFKARKLGAALVAQNAARHLQGPLADKDGGWQPLIYCWRGGQRSGAFAAILKQIGWRADVIEGGYRSYRRLVSQTLYETRWPTPVTLIDGNTGTAKTDVLQRLSARGVQVIDLEGLAAHRGSLFGETGRSQPSQKAFETAIAAALAGFDPGRPVVLEAESSKVGNLLVPPALWAAMQEAPRIEIEAPLEARATYLVQAYGDLAAQTDAAHALLDKLVAFHGRETVKHWKVLFSAGAFRDLAAELMIHHYDPRYGKSRGRTDGHLRQVVRTDRLDAQALDALADAVIAHL